MGNFCAPVNYVPVANGQPRSLQTIAARTFILGLERIPYDELDILKSLKLILENEHMALFAEAYEVYKKMVYVGAKYIPRNECSCHNYFGGLITTQASMRYYTLSIRDNPRHRQFHDRLGLQHYSGFQY